MSWDARSNIVGIGETEYHKVGTVTERSEFELACEAIRNAAEDAGIEVDDIDGFASYAHDRNDGTRVAEALGIPDVNFTNMVWEGGGGGAAAAVMNAAMAVHAGAAEYVVAYRALCQGQFGRFGQARGGNTASGDMAFSRPFGLETPPQMYALMVQRYMHEYDVPEEHMGHVALTSRKHANNNPRSVMGGDELTMEEYMNSRSIADPLKLYDCCLESDGACAMIITSPENAADLDQQAVEVHSAVQGGSGAWGNGPLSSHNMPLDEYATANSSYLADELYARGDYGPDDVDVAQLYENFTGLVLMLMEDYDLAPRGEAGSVFASGETLAPDGEIPINTAGGNLSEAYIHGFNCVAEGARQIRGTSPNQVEDADVSLVAAGPGVTPTSGLLFTPA